ncbi:hypothetical protein SAMN00777080_4059 [Aquiflexum balticum DSM 16537]|uniref:Uncharacterized protein n=1 Tax=Aquiflexum balticum DSM 16537 TaxID=758820 RepID=A0A1W2H972_9BACT|nr:hypothetical protein SAMN00777080_4059 [Aquiflexum balticum DSM 16537]
MKTKLKDSVHQKSMFSDQPYFGNFQKDFKTKLMNESIKAGVNL